MSNVYYKKINSETDVNDIKEMTKELLNTLISKEDVTLEKKIPLKVHFGEKGNVTFIKSENFEGIIDFLKNKNIETCYIETNVMDGGQRYKRELHLKTAEEHGFTQLPIIIADGDHGEAFEEVEINKKNFKSCKIGKAFLDYNQLIILSHFKGHMLTGFGGAIKQLAMGHAAKGGKLAMHMGTKPIIKNKKCNKCNLCQTVCNENAITIDDILSIDYEKCVGCSACVAICPNGAFTIFSIKSLMKFAGIGNPIKEKLVETAFAAAKDKKNIYINFAMNITSRCDCEGKKFKILMDDVGIFISTDPVAIDKACYDMIKEKGKKFRGAKQFAYAEKIGLGSTKYQLIEV